MIKHYFLTGCMLAGIVLTQAQTDSTHVTDNQSDTTKTTSELPLFSTSGGEAEADLEQQDVSSLLQSSRDVFAQFSSFHFGVGRYRMRGLQAENQLVMINGNNVNNLETGFSVWSSWGGLNDVTRFVENRFGLAPSRVGFSGAGGYTNIESKASSFRKGTRISYAFSNRIFRHRVMVTHSTGMMQNGWALTVSASTRQGDNVYVPGTYFNANAFYVSLDKRLNDKHLLSLTSFVAPIEQGRASQEIQEAYDLAGTNYYNSNWGFQNGKARNASVSRTQRPMAMLSHHFNINTATKLTTSLFFNFGKNSLTGLNWNNSPNPRPNYYRYLPSYFYSINETAQGDAQKELWLNDVNTRQINWDRLIAMNQSNLYSLPGTGINTSEKRSRYILERRIQNLQNIGFNTIYNTRLDNLFISAGLNANIYKNNYYKEVEDLLGGTFWLDVDQFAQDQGVTANFASNNLDDPNRPIRKDDKFGYDYFININRIEGWGQAEYTLNNFDFYGALSLSNSSIQRDSKVANGKFPETSKGKGEKKSFFNYGIKGGLTYKFNGRLFATANVAYLTRTPEANNIFMSPQTRSDIIKGVSSEEVLSYDVNFHVKYPTLKVRATYYNNMINNQIYSRGYWYDIANTNVTYIMTGVNQKFEGIELGVEKTLFTSHVIQAAVGISDNIYTSRPIASAILYNSTENLFDNRTVYLKNYKVGGSPQNVMGIGYRYVARKFWSAGIAFSYFDGIYLEPNPDRRTAEALEKYTSSDPQYGEITKQDKLPSNFTIDLNASKSWRIQRNYFLSLNAGINNLLDNTEFRTGGFEQLRWDNSLPQRFPNRYNYAFGRTYMLSVNFRF
ncbi:MAG: TonB-dependent receptor [Sediminibacterium sp.]|nr:TonB-dependent receptor [Sediminibacterium sp.]